jgi:hypothetical protein
LARAAAGEPFARLALRIRRRHFVAALLRRTAFVHEASMTRRDFAGVAFV